MAKKLGRKSGEGFYVWQDGKAVKSTAPVAPPPPDLEDRLILALGSFFATLFSWKRSTKYSGAEVIAGDGACDAARSLANLRFLSADVPPLPLETCDRRAICKCKYRHFNDRRRPE